MTEDVANRLLCISEAYDIGEQGRKVIIQIAFKRHAKSEEILQLVEYCPGLIAGKDIKLFREMARTGPVSWIRIYNAIRFEEILGD